MVMHIYKPRTQKAEAGNLRVQGQPELHNEILSQKTKKPAEPGAGSGL
jgi:hypothetical protein